MATTNSATVLWCSLSLLGCATQGIGESATVPENPRPNRSQHSRPEVDSLEAVAAGVVKLATSDVLDSGPATELLESIELHCVASRLMLTMAALECIMRFPAGEVEPPESEIPEKLLHDCWSAMCAGDLTALDKMRKEAERWCARNSGGHGLTGQFGEVLAHYLVWERGLGGEPFWARASGFTQTALEELALGQRRVVGVPYQHGLRIAAYQVLTILQARLGATLPLPENKLR